VFNFRILKTSDLILWVCLIVLLFISFIVIYSATSLIDARLSPESFIFIKKHFFSLILALFFLGFFSYIDYQHLKRLSWILYAAMILVLGLVIFFGYTSLGAQRWLAIGPLSFQPSEIVKLFFVIVLANYLYTRKGKINNIRALLPVLLLAAPPFLLIFKQPDLGTALVLIFILLGMLIWSEISPVLLILMISPVFSILLRQFLFIWIIYLVLLFVCLYLARIRPLEFALIMLINIGVGVAFPYLWQMLKDYQKMRIISFLNPAADPLGAGYHSLQSKIAIGSGGFFGKGLFHGTQSQLQYIPIQYSDFIYAVIGEEFGFIGSFGVLTLFMFLIWRIISVATTAMDSFGSLLAAGIACMLTFHVLVNMGMTLGILPIVGIPLPFVSYGGSSLLMNMAAIGIVQSIAMRRQKLIF